MPNTKIERIIFALLTVFITVHCFVFYCLAIEMGGMPFNVLVKELMSLGLDVTLHQEDAPKKTKRAPVAGALEPFSE